MEQHIQEQLDDLKKIEKDISSITFDKITKDVFELAKKIKTTHPIVDNLCDRLDIMNKISNAFGNHGFMKLENNGIIFKSKDITDDKIMELYKEIHKVLGFRNEKGDSFE